MEVTSDVLRDNLSRKSSEELRRVAESTEGEYTPEAVALARAILTERPAETENEARHSDSPSADGVARWSGLGTALVTLLIAKRIFYALWSAQKDPAGARGVLQAVVTSPWPYVLVVLVVVWFVRAGRSAPRGQ